MGRVRTTRMRCPPNSRAFSSGNGSEYPPSNIHSPLNLTLPRVTKGSDADATNASNHSRPSGMTYLGMPSSNDVVTTMASVLIWACLSASKFNGACRMTWALRWVKFISPSLDHAEENRMNLPSSTSSFEMR